MPTVIAALARDAGTLDAACAFVRETVARSSPILADGPPVGSRRSEDQP
jgi:hypothetical protein